MEINVKNARIIFDLENPEVKYLIPKEIIVKGLESMIDYKDRCIQNKDKRIQELEEKIRWGSAYNHQIERKNKDLKKEIETLKQNSPIIAWDKENSWLCDCIDCLNGESERQREKIKELERRNEGLTQNIFAGSHAEYLVKNNKDLKEQLSDLRHDFDELNQVKIGLEKENKRLKEESCKLDCDFLKDNRRLEKENKELKNKLSYFEVVGAVVIIDGDQITIPHLSNVFRQAKVLVDTFDKDRNELHIVIIPEIARLSKLIYKEKT